MLYYDQFCTIGKTHTVCEDYIAQGEIPTPFIILSDGCSASNHTEIGSRILVSTAKHLFENAKEFPPDYTIFGNQLITTAWDVAQKLLPSPLTTNDSILDATTMLAFVHNSEILVYIYGDGCIFYKDYQGNVHTIDINFTHNAPYYLTYWLNPKRRAEYERYDQKPLFIIDSVSGRSLPLSFTTPLIFRFALNQFKTIAIASDGATSFIKFTQAVKLSLYTVAVQLLDIKGNIDKEFAKCHVTNTLEKYAQDHIFPVDDLSIGMFTQIDV